MVRVDDATERLYSIINIEDIGLLELVTSKVVDFINYDLHSYILEAVNKETDMYVIKAKLEMRAEQLCVKYGLIGIDQLSDIKSRFVEGVVRLSLIVIETCKSYNYKMTTNYLIQTDRNGNILLAVTGGF